MAVCEVMWRTSSREGAPSRSVIISSWWEGEEGEKERRQ